MTDEEIARLRAWVSTGDTVPLKPVAQLKIVAALDALTAAHQRIENLEFQLEALQAALAEQLEARAKAEKRIAELEEEVASLRAYYIEPQP